LLYIAVGVLFIIASRNRTGKHARRFYFLKFSDETPNKFAKSIVTCLRNNHENIQKQTHELWKRGEGNASKGTMFQEQRKAFLIPRRK
jgi:hypothetical protein